MRVLIATPSYSAMFPDDYVASLIQTIHALNDAGIAYNWIYLSKCSFLPQARDILADIFLSHSAFTHLLFIDSDMRWTPDTAPKLLSHNAPVVAAPAISRTEENATWNFTPIPGESPNENGLLRVKQIGTGVMLISRDTLESVASTATSYGAPMHALGGKMIKNIFPTAIINNVFHGEDFTFCATLTSLSIPIAVDTTLAVGHLGSKWYTGDVSVFHEK